MWMWKDAKINSPKDLVGKTIGAPLEDAQWTIFPALATANGFAWRFIDFWKKSKNP